MVFRSFIGSFVCGLAIIPILVSGSAPPTVAEVLRRHHIALTRSALVAALRNPDAEVRGLAAQQLVDDKAREIIPSIEQAPVSETDDAARVNIAYALAQFGSQTGMSALTEACHSMVLKTALRIRATDYLIDLGNEECLKDILYVLNSRDPETAIDRAMALGRVAHFKHPSETEATDLFTATVSELEDSDSSVRISAGDALRWLGNPQAIPYLRGAIVAEQEDVVRTQLQDALDILEKRALSQ